MPHGQWVAFNLGGYEASPHKCTRSRTRRSRHPATRDHEDYVSLVNTGKISRTPAGDGGAYTLPNVQYTFTSLSSSHISGIAYNDVKNYLVVHFHYGDIYLYFSVMPHIYNELLVAPSAGRFFHERISGKYQYRRIRLVAQTPTITTKRTAPVTTRSSAHIANPESSGCLVCLILSLTVAIGWLLPNLFRSGL